MEFVIFLLYLLICYKSNKCKNDISFLFATLIMCIICANRSMSIPDTVPYIEIYEGNTIATYEKGFIYLCDFFRNLGASFGLFLFILNFVGLSIWFYITKRIVNKRNLFLAFIIYTSYMGIYYHGIVLRAGLAILINYIGIYYGLIKNKKYIVFYICVFVSLLFHISAILFVLLPFIVQRKYNPKFLYTILIASFFFMILNSNLTLLINPLTTVMDQLPLIGVARLEGYIEKAEEATLSLTHIKYLLTGLTLVYLSHFMSFQYNGKEKFNLFLNIYIIGLVLLFLFSFAPGAARIAQLFLFFEYLPFILLYEGIAFDKKKYLRLLMGILIIMNVLNLYSMVPALWNYCS